MADLRSVTIRLEREQFEKIERLAAKNDSTISDTVRELISVGLREKVFGENAELLADVVREQMNAVMADYTERINESIENVLYTADENKKPGRDQLKDYRITAFFRQCPDESGIVH